MWRVSFFFALCGSLWVAPGQAQQRVAPGNLYERVLCVVPMVGRGTADDPRRPDHVPWPPDPKAVAAGRGILGFTYQVSDDGQVALVELVARDRKALEPVLNDRRPGVKVFERGRTRAVEIETEFRKHKRDFQLDRLQVNVP
jgi:hypothetical protein